jgi:N utilization substance protein A
MATQKKIKKKQTKPKKTFAKRETAAKRPANKKRGIPKKKSANKPTQKKRTKTKPGGKKTINRKAVNAPTKQLREKSQSVDMVSLRREGRRSRSGGQSGDLQGLSNIAGADSESVDELLEEGNAFEADAVKGVEDAGDFDERGVRTHEVAEDDIPEEYLDEK